MDVIGRTRGGHRQQPFGECACVLSRHYDRTVEIIGLVFPRSRFCESNSNAMRKPHCNKTICPLGRHVK
jgi:hypothetical protein